ncbi:hypothetical protein D3C84_1144490 [compost metagenome]
MPPMLVTGAVLVTTLRLQPAGQYEQTRMTKVMTKTCARQGIELSRRGQAKQVPQANQIQMGIGML